MSIDGQSVAVVMTRAEERQMRMTLRPFIQAARRVEPIQQDHPPSVALSDRVRAARVQALLGVVHATPTRVENGPLDALVERAAEVYSKSLADQTRATYRRRWLQFESWCARHGVPATPADATTVMLYLADLIDQEPQPSLSTLRGRVNAINRVHLELDLPVPGDDPSMAMLMRGLSRSIPRTTQAQLITALRVEDLRAICAALDHPDPVVVRDAALLRLHLAGVSCGALSRLRWCDIRFRSDHMLLGTRRALNAKPDTWLRVETGADPHRSPVSAMQRWKSVAGESPPLVFTVVDRLGRRSTNGLRTDGVSRVITERQSSLVAQHGLHVAPLAAAADLLHDVANDVLRDRALLVVGFAGAFRRGELTRLVWDDVRFVDEGMVVRLRRSKTDPMGHGRDVGIPWGHSLLTCPVRALSAWQGRMQLQLREEHTGATACFPKIGKAGRITAEQPLTEEGLTMVVKRRMTAAGIPGHWGGRSLRAGFISSAADLDIPLDLVAQQSRHASLDSLVRYIRAEDPFRRNAADRIGL
jgi:integrase